MEGTAANMVDRRKSRPYTTWASCALLIAPVLLGEGGLPSVEAEAPSQSDRVVHVFDFDERDEGNLESVPKYWMPFGGVDFPRFARGAFDSAVGHDAPPSFHLDSQGRNIAYRYLGGATRVRPGSDYLVVGWVRGEGLVNARASLSAYYLDGERLPITSTQRFSQLVADDAEGQTWHRVEVFLPAGPPQAKTIGLTAWVVQEQEWRTDSRTTRHIVRYDVEAGAWFDDITIYRLPRVTLATAVPGNVFRTGHERALLVLVADANPADLKATLEVFDVRGAMVRSVPVRVGPGEEEQPTAIDLGGIDDGLYRARVRVHAGEEVLANRVLAFGSIGAGDYNTSGPARSYGIVLDAGDRADPSTELALVNMLNVGQVKVPVWSGWGHIPDLADASQASDMLLYELLKRRVAITGVFAGPPSELVRAAGAYPRSLLALLDGDLSGWGRHLVGVVAPYSSVFRSWQVGKDDDPDIVSDPRLERVIARIRTEMERLTTAPNLTSPGSLTRQPSSGPAAADELCLTLKNTILPRFIKSHIDEYRRRGQPVSSVYIQPPQLVGVDRLGQLRDWCKRLIWTRHAGIKTVFVPQPWHTRATLAGSVTEPTAELILLNTVVNLIGDALPGDAVYVAPGVTALAFHRGEKTVLSMWDERAGAGAGGRAHPIQLGPTARRVDMWGHPAPLERTEDGRQLVTLGPAPIFIDGVDRWLVMFRTLVTLTPARAELSIDKHHVELRIANPHAQPIQGHARIVSPDGWSIKPRRFSFHLAPGEQIAKPLNIRFDRDQTAGTQTINVHFDLQTGEEYKLVVPLALELGTKGFDAWGLAFVAGDRLIVRHGVTNRSSEALSLRSFAIAPGRLRQYRILSELQPRRTRTVEYAFKNPELLRGRTLRLQLRELNGPRIHNLEIVLE